MKELSSNARPQFERSDSSLPGNWFKRRKAVVMATSRPAGDESFTIRRATFRDVNGMSKTMKSAFWDEGFIGRFLHARKEQYPGDVVRWCRHKLLGALLDWRHKVMIAVDAETGEVLGLADWWRNGPKAKESKARDGDTSFVRTLSDWDLTADSDDRLGGIMSPVYKTALYLCLEVRPYRSVSDPIQLTAFDRAILFVEHHWAAPRDEVWDLAICGVANGHQGKGIGRQLVVWGLTVLKKGMSRRR